MKKLLMAVGSCSAALGAGEAIEFKEPIRLKAGETPIRMESPGFAAPCWVDFDKDGKSDLVVGQFNQGKMHVHKGLGGLQFAAGEFLKAEGSVALVPGIW